MPTRKQIRDETAEIIKTSYTGSDYYRATYECSNCGWRGSIRFKKGTTAPLKDTCPQCLCFKAEKALPYGRKKPEPAPVQRDPVPAIPVPGPAVPYPWPNVRPFPSPVPPNDPWNVPHQPYRPWDEPTRPYFDTSWQRQVGVKDDADHCTGMGFHQ